MGLSVSGAKLIRPALLQARAFFATQPSSFRMKRHAPAKQSPNLRAGSLRLNHQAVFMILRSWFRRVTVIGGLPCACYSLPRSDIRTP